MKRRTLLASLGGGIPVSTAGCIGFVRDRLDRQPKRQFRLGWLSAANTDTEPHQIELQVKEDGDVVHQSSHELRGQDKAYPKGEPHITVAECTWGSGTDDYLIRARVDENDWIAKSITAVDMRGHPNTDCVVAQGRYRNERLEIVLQAGCDYVERWEGGCSFANE